MAAFFAKILDNGNLIDIISCVFTVMALVFTLYFWLLDHLSEDESKFIEGKSETLAVLNKSLKTTEDLMNSKEFSEDDFDRMRQAIEDVNKKLEIVLNYRFWARSRQKEEYAKVSEFYRDSRYLISTIRRCQESPGQKNDQTSIVGIQTLDPDQVADIRSDYLKGLYFVIEFIENWE